MTGTTTIVFTDVTGSTELVHRLGDAEGAGAITGHLRLLRGEVERSHGKVVKTLGDGVMAVFSTAYDGVMAAVAMQQAADRVARRGEGPDLASASAFTSETLSTMAPRTCSAPPWSSLAGCVTRRVQEKCSPPMLSACLSATDQKWISSHGRKWS